MPTNQAKGSVREGEVGKKTKATQDAGGKSMSEKSQSTCPRAPPINPAQIQKQDIIFRL
jgi:hypothetical protein